MSHVKCFKVMGNNTEEVPAAANCQKDRVEADTCLLLHAAHAASEGYDAVVISSDDFDVFVLLSAFCENINAGLFQKCGTRACTKFLQSFSRCLDYIISQDVIQCAV